MSEWTTERDGLLRKHWGDGSSAADIAKTLGGFEGCTDGGRQAVLGRVHRHREKAKKARDAREESFWTRAKTSHGRTRRESDPGGKLKQRAQLRADAYLRNIEEIPAATLKPDPRFRHNPAFHGVEKSASNPDGLTASELAAFEHVYESLGR